MDGASRKKSEGPVDWGELYGQVVSLGISPEYFFDKMSFSEISELLKGADNKRRDEWERTRLICFYGITFNDKIKSPEDLFKLPWDKKKQKVKSNKKPEQLKQAAKQVEKWLNGRFQQV